MVLAAGRGALDHAEFRRNRLNSENVIDSKSLERDLCEKPVSTFSHRALERRGVVCPPRTPISPLFNHKACRGAIAAGRLIVAASKEGGGEAMEGGNRQ